MLETQLCCQILMNDHRETEKLLDQMQQALSSKASLAVLSASSKRLHQMLDIHFACEEHGLFPVLNAYQTMILMEIEHDDLLQKEADFAQALSESLKQKQVLPELSDAFEKWNERLRAHILEEERGIFPKVETVLEPEEKALVARKMQEIVEQAHADPMQVPALNRPTPTCQLERLTFDQPPAKPVAFDRRFSVDHASMSHIQLQAGQKLSRHWAAEQQCLVVLSGEVVFQSDTETQTLTASSQVTMEPRFYFALQAVQDTHILLFKVWPKPHFVRV